MIRPVQASDVPPSYGLYFTNPKRRNYGIYVEKSCVGILGVKELDRDEKEAEISLAFFKEYAFKIPYFQIKKECFLFIANLGYNTLNFRTANRGVLAMIRRLGADFVGIVSNGEYLFELKKEKTT